MVGRAFRCEPGTVGISKEVIVGRCDWCGRQDETPVQIPNESGVEALAERCNWTTGTDAGNRQREFCCRRCRAEYWERDVENRLDELDAAKNRTPVLMDGPSFSPERLLAEIQTYLGRCLADIEQRGRILETDDERIAAGVLSLIVSAFDSKGDSHGAS